MSGSKYTWTEDYSDRETCPACGGEMFVEASDHPECWGEDVDVEESALIPCPLCGDIGEEE